MWKKENATDLKNDEHRFQMELILRHGCKYFLLYFTNRSLGNVIEPY